MIAKCTCQSCGGSIEFDAGQYEPGMKAPCPHCGKEMELAVTKPVLMPSKPRSTAGYTIGITFLVMVGCGMVFAGCLGAAGEMSGEGSAVRGILYALNYCAGFVLIGLALVLSALANLLKRP